MSEVFLQNYTFTVKENNNKDESEIIEIKVKTLKQNVIDLYYLLKSFKSDPKLKGVTNLIKKELVDGLFNNLNISLRNQKPSENFDKMFLLPKVAKTQGLMNSISFVLYRLTDYYADSDNKKLLYNLKKSQNDLYTPAKLFDKHVFSKYRKYYN